jgi:hypothetical protein
LSLLLSRMTEFSPVTITLFTSTVLIADVSELGLNTPIIAEPRQARAHRKGEYDDHRRRR